MTTDTHAGGRRPPDARRTLLDAAQAEFAARGLHGARAEEIAARAGVNKRLLYHYFGGKDALHARVLERAGERLARHEAGVGLDAGDPAAAVGAIVSARFDYFADHPDVLRLLNDAGLRGVTWPLATAPGRPGSCDRLTAVLAEGRRRGLFGDADPVQLSLAVTAVAYVYLCGPPGPAALQGDAHAGRAHYRQHAVDLILSYLCL